MVTLSCALLVVDTSQLPSMCPWSSKDTVQTGSPSSVDTVIFSLTPTGYTMGQRRMVNSLALPSLVQCTHSRVLQSTERQSADWAMCKLLMVTSFSVCTAYWATSSRAMQSSTPSSLLVSLKWWHGSVYSCYFVLSMNNIHTQRHTHTRTQTHSTYRHTHTHSCWTRHYHALWVFCAHTH